MLDFLTVHVTLRKEVLAPSLLEVKETSNVSCTMSKLSSALLIKGLLEISAESFDLKFPLQQNHYVVKNMVI